MHKTTTTPGLRWLGVVALAIGLVACAGGPGAGGSGSAGRTPPRIAAPLPGGVQFYAWGYGQTFENFVNVERAQSEYSRYRTSLRWSDDGPSNTAGTTIGGLQAYLPLHVRWKLKDGREFILENIDINAIMLDYFKTHTLQMQWQREGRPEHFGDAYPLLAHEVKDDTVIIKWVIRINHTPVNERLTPTGAATKWDIRYEEHIVTTLRGQPTQGIDFENKQQFSQPAAPAQQK